MKAGTKAVLAATGVGLWTALVGAALPALTWVVEQLLLVEEVRRPWWLWPLASWSGAVLAWVPAYLLAQLARAPAIRAAARAWAGAALLLGLLGSARAVPTQLNEAYLALLTVLALLPLALPTLRGCAGRDSGAAPGLVAGLAVLLPWLLLAALGGLLETGLALAAALATGWLAATLLDRTLWQSFAGPGRARLVLLGGLVAGVALVPLAAAVGGAGVNLLEILVLPPLGFVAAALRRRRAVAAALALAAVGPLAFVEPVQTTVLLGLGDVGFWAVLAALASLSVAVLLAIGYGLALRHAMPRAVAGGLVAVLLAGGLAGYLALGHPGLYGDRLFVVFKARADLAGVAAMGDVRARRTEAYRRLVDTANRSQRSLRHTLTLLHIRHTSYYLVNGLEVDGGPEVRAWLSRRAEVDRVLLSPRPRPVPRAPAPLSGPARPDGSPQWNVALLGADRIWATGDTGTGIVVGSSDSGVDGTHPALAANFRGGDDSWFDPWNHTRAPTDHSGHGTHTLGTAVGRAGIGVAPGAQWMGCVDLDRNMGNPARYLDCLQYMLAPFPYGGDPLSDGRPERAADVLSNSWGCASLEGCDRGALRPAVDALTTAGIFVVAAAGNAGPRCGSISDPPAPYPDAVTVGAVDRSGKLASFSSRGPVPGASKPDLVAPGTSILSAVPGGGYRRLDGTSMAAPHVAGVVALMWAANPTLVGDVAGTAALLRRTARPAAGGGCTGDTGAGLVDAYAAVRAARTQ
ncbi:MAG: hypothetical protein V7603_4450 [Micromonosporaceae bacterium]